MLTERGDVAITLFTCILELSDTNLGSSMLTEGVFFFCGFPVSLQVFFFYLIHLNITVCPETFSNLCGNSVNDM